MSESLQTTSTGSGPAEGALGSGSAQVSAPTDGRREVKFAWGTHVDISDPSAPTARYIVQLTRPSDATTAELATDLRLLRGLDGTLRTFTAVCNFALVPREQLKNYASAVIGRSCEQASAVLDRVESFQMQLDIQVTRPSESDQSGASAIKITCSKLDDNTTKALMTYLDNKHSQQVKQSTGKAIDRYGTVHERQGLKVLILSTYLVLLNVVGWLAQRLLSAGLLGQILIGVIYGSPLAGWLDHIWEEALIAVGYVGLLLLVFEGGMSSSMENLLPVLPVSICIALTGLLTPIALSFILVPLGSFPTVHAFAAGSALSSTSLGTVLAVLNPASIGFDLRQTRLGTALLSAAVMDDVVAFILVKILQVIGDTPGAGGSVLGANIGRTIGVTIGLGAALFIATKWIFIPGYPRLQRGRCWRWAVSKTGAAPMVMMLEALLFFSMVAAAGYAGTSPLYGAYNAGLSIAAIDSAEDASARLGFDHDTVGMAQNADRPLRRAVTYPGTASSRPNVFASESDLALNPRDRAIPTYGPQQDGEGRRMRLTEAFERYIGSLLTYLLVPIFFGSIGYCIPFVPLWRGAVIWRGVVYAVLMLLGKVLCGIWILIWAKRAAGAWRGAVFLGGAMVARGEIGLLISQVAYHTETPLFTEDEFLIVIWAIVLCTILGPCAVGWTVKRWDRRILDGGWD